MADSKQEWNNVADTGEFVIANLPNAQTFTLGTTGANATFDISSIKMKMSKIDGSPGTISFAIRATSGGEPDGGDLSTGSTNGNTLPTYPTSELREITMTSYELEASTQYAIIIEYSAGDDYLTSDAGDAYGGGTYLVNVGEWIDLETDTNFEVWGETVTAGTNAQINIGDDWKEISAAQINIGDAWKAVAGMQINIGDTWKEIF